MVVFDMVVFDMVWGRQGSVEKEREKEQPLSPPAENMACMSGNVRVHV